MERNLMVLFLYLILFIYIIVFWVSPPKGSKIFFYNGVIQFVFLALAFPILSINPSLGVVYVVAYLVTYFSLYYQNIRENFSVVENDLTDPIEIERDSLLSRLENNEEVVEGVWGCGTLGKDMGLCKS